MAKPKARGDSPAKGVAAKLNPALWKVRSLGLELFTPSRPLIYFGSQSLFAQ